MTGKQASNTSSDSIEFECDLPEAPEKVWRALTVPELLAAWMMPNDMTPEIGSRFAFAKPGAPIECEILDAEPGRLLRYSWRERGRTLEEVERTLDRDHFMTAREARDGVSSTMFSTRENRRREDRLPVVRAVTVARRFETLRSGLDMMAAI
jgi:uncharacterized protein YndB with AHSA1/START domain